jgi:photosystem II stability/assembly factor-like uncharacterized protein
MKKRLLLVVLLCWFSISNCHAQWEWQNPLPQGNNLNSVSFSNETTGFVVGDIGTVLKSTDAGASWSKIDINIQYNLNKIFFLNENYGWIVGDAGTYIATTNGGIDWEQININTTKNLNDIQMLDNSNGYICGDSGIVLTTTNFGSIWISKTISGQNFNGLYFYNSNAGFVIGSWHTGGYEEVKSIYKTTDGGLTWTHTTYNRNTIPYKITCFSESIGWYVQEGGAVQKTTNSGKTWISKKTGYTNALYDILYTDANNLFAVGSGGIILRSYDGGENWYLISSATNKALTSIFNVSNTIMVAVGFNGTIIRSTDSGDTWTNQLQGSLENIVSIHSPNTNCAWAVSNNYDPQSNAIYKTINAGKMWEKITLPLNEKYFYVFNNVFAFDENNAFICGSTRINTSDIGAFFKTTDGGKYWEIIDISYTGYVSDIKFINNEIGYATEHIGSSNRYEIIKTTNRGLTWFPTQNISSTSSLNSIYLVDEVNVIAVGANGFIIKSSDGGISWQIQNNGLPVSAGLGFNSVAFTDINNGWIVGEQGILLYTTNGGENWYSKPSKTKEILHKIQFVDKENGYICGANGLLMNTNDGGKTWNFEKKITNKNLFSLFFHNQNTGWIVGTEGTIIHLGDGTIDVKSDYISSKDHVTIAPNPTSDIISISFSNSGLSNASISIYNSLGIQIKRFDKNELTGQSSISFSTEEFPIGMYYCVLTSEGNRITKSFIVLR